MLTNDNTYDNVDWDAVNEQVNKTLPTGKYGRGESAYERVFLSLPEGTHTLRIIPSGNGTEKLPYLFLKEHKFMLNSNEGKKQFINLVCWKHLYDNLLSKPDDQKKERSLLSYLGRNNLIGQDDYNKYMTHGCPWCKAHAYLNMHGVEQDVRRNFWPTDTYYWNVIWRVQNGSGDGRVYIWRQSKTQFNTIIQSIKLAKEASGGRENYIDANIGRDVMVQARGIGLARRYPVLQFVGWASPLDLGEKTPHSLEANTLNRNFKTYQDSCNLMKQVYGKVLLSYGYTIPGDMVLTQQYQDGVKVVEGVEQIINQGIPAYEVRSQMSEKTPDIAQVPTRRTFPNGMYEENGMLYNADGTAAF